MNKLIKGAVAGAAGIALLLGGAGTFAMWNDSKDLGTPSHISTGTLTVAKSDDGEWEDASGKALPENYLLVPGTTIKWTQTVTIHATGTGLTAKLGYTGGGLDQVNGAAIDDASDFSTSVAIDGTLPQGITGSNGTYTIDASELANGSATFKVALTLTFDGTHDNATREQGISLALTPVTVTLTQLP